MVGAMTAGTLVLLGDSILDNAPYTAPEPDSTEHLQGLLPQWSVQRLARDGARMADVRGQLEKLETRASIAILSIGGNDAIEHVGLLDRSRTSSADIFERLFQIADEFEKRYETLARSVASKSDRTVLCTIYEVQLEPPIYAKLAKVPLAVLNDRIIRTASRLGLDVLELRTVCPDPEDFVMQIEPSARGAEKIARAIAHLVNGGSELTSGRVFSH